jgi:hypothetical protein
VLQKALSSDLAAKVKGGDAHWVTVKEGPLEGRHLLINGARPANGQQSSGKILAGHGIPAHVIEKITGASEGSDIKHVHDEDAHLLQAFAHSARLSSLGDALTDVLKDHLKREFASTGVDRLAVVQTGKRLNMYRVPVGEPGTPDSEVIKDFIRIWRVGRGSEITIIHKHGVAGADDTSVFNSTGKQLKTGYEKEKREKRQSQSSQLLSTLAKFGVDRVEFNKESQTDKERKAIAEAATNAFRVLSETSPLGAVRKTTVTLMLGKLSVGSKAWAHYTPSQKAIYMTSKQNGMKPFFHEYGHAMDHAVSGYSGYASENGILKPLIDAIRETESHQTFIAGIGKEGTRWSGYNTSGKWGRSYYGSGRETFARFFSEYTNYKAEKENVNVPEELREPLRDEMYSPVELDRLGAVFEGIMKDNHLEKSLPLGFIAEDKEVRKSMRTKSEWSQVKRRKESEYGKEVYADPAHDSYPLTVGGKPSRKETMAAWRYLHVAENRAKYSDEAYRHVASRIRSFAKKHFDEELQSPDEANKSLRIVFPIAR